MVLDLLLSPHKARREPWDLFWLAFIFVSLGVIVQWSLPGFDGSAVVFAMVPAIPLIWTLLNREEEEDESFHRHNRGFFDYHGQLIEIFAFFFLGATFAYTFWYLFLSFLPVFAASATQQDASDAVNTVFSAQIKEIDLVKNAASGYTFNQGFFEFILANNLKVMALMFIFCLVYSIGSIYLLLWNASVIGVFIGSKIHDFGIEGVVMAFLGILPHGSLEVAAYFVASMAGGILSVAISRKRWQTHPHEFKFVMLDVAMLALLAILILIVGAFLEASYVS